MTFSPYYYNLKQNLPCFTLALPLGVKTRHSTTNFSMVFFIPNLQKLLPGFKNSHNFAKISPLFFTQAKGGCHGAIKGV